MSDYRIPISDHIKTILNKNANALGQVLPEDWGFCLLLFEYIHNEGESGQLCYISSAERADMIKVMQEFISKQSS